MALAAQVKADMIAAMKAGDKEKLGALRFVSSEITRAAKDAGMDEATDELTMQVLEREGKRRKDAIKLAAEGGRTAPEEEYELTIIQAYLPEQMTDEELKAVITSAVTPGMSLGDAMKAVGALTKGRADGSRTSALVREILG